MQVLVFTKYKRGKSDTLHVFSGHTTILDENYETIRELRAGNHRLTDKHEFHVINEKTALIQIYHPVPWNLSAYGGSEEQQWIVDARFQGRLWYSISSRLLES